MKSPTEKLQNTISRLPFTDSGIGFSVLNPEYGPQQVDELLSPSYILYALQQAADARIHADSYRNFNVGAAVLAYNPAPSPSRLQILTGVNIKPEEETEVNVHAEQLAFQKARDRGFVAVRLVAVVGETQNDTQSGHQMYTLHPCGLCRGFMEHSAMVNNETTLIATALPDLRTIEFSSINGLKRYHEEQDFSAVTRIDVPDLRMLQPVATGNVIRLVDDDASVEEDRIWTPLIFNAIQEFKRSAQKETKA